MMSSDVETGVHDELFIGRYVRLDGTGIPGRRGHAKSAKGLVH